MAEGPITPQFLVNERLTTGVNISRGTLAKIKRRRPIPRGTISIPPGCLWLRAIAKRLWDQLNAAVAARYSEVNLTHSAILQTIIRAETAVLLMERWRRDRWDVLTTDQCVTINKQIVNISVQRDKAIMALGINPNELDVFGAALDAAPDASLMEGPDGEHRHGQ